jgi:hypothetical protein
MQAERINLDSSVFPNRDLSAVGHRIGEFATQCGHIFLHQLLVGLQGCESSINLTEGACIIIDISNILKRPADFCLH